MLCGWKKMIISSHKYNTCYQFNHCIVYIILVVQTCTMLNSLVVNESTIVMESSHELITHLNAGTFKNIACDFVCL